MRYKNISGIILARGKSRRMGFFKPFLEIGGKRMIDVIIDKLKPFFGEMMIVTDDKDRFAEYKEIKVIEDLVKGCGPLGGIYTGLKKMSGESAFFIACDMPFLHNGLIKKILDIAVSSDAEEVILPCAEGKMEPLHAVYSRKILRKMEKALAEKRLSIKDFLKSCDCKYVEVREDERKSFANINTREDLKEYSDPERVALRRANSRTMKVKSKVWIEKDGKSIFGEGKARLLQAIEKTGSINEAAQLMGISFRRAWSYITTMEKRLDFLLVDKNRGGKGGGGSSLTEEAKRFLCRYEKLNKEVRAFADKKFREIWK